MIEATGGKKNQINLVEPEKFTTVVKTVDFTNAIKDLDHNPIIDPIEGIKRTTKWMKETYKL